MSQTILNGHKAPLCITTTKRNSNKKKKIKQSKYITDTSKYIFIPDADYCKDGSVNFVGRSGYVWSSSLYTLDPYYAWNLYFDSDSCSVGEFYRFHGRSVRGVCK